MFLPRAIVSSMGVCILLTALSLGGCGGARERYESHLQRGKQLLQQGNLEKANIEFRNAQQIQPKDAVAMFLIGKVAERRGNPREAVRFYQAAVDVDAAYDPARAGLGKMFVLAGDAKRAVQLVAPGLVRHPEEPDLLAVRAAAHFELKDLESARSDAERAVKVAPANENAVAILAAIYAKSDERPRAIAITERAVGLAPDSVPLREVLVNLYLQDSQLPRAVAQMRKIVDLEPRELAPRSQLASHLTRAHDLDGAQRVLEEAVQAFDAQSAQANADAAKLLLVEFLASQRSSEEGERTLKVFIEKSPDDMDLRLGLGTLLQRSGAAEKALAAYRQIIEHEGSHPKGLLARDRMAAVELARGNRDAARQLLSEVLRHNGRDNDALIMRASIELQANDPTSAISDLRAVLRDQPNSAPLQRSLAAAYLAKGEPALAEEALRSAMQSAPGDVAVRIELAELLGRTARIGQAVTLLEETVKRAPADASARVALIKSYLADKNGSAARTAAEELKARLPQSPLGFYLAAQVETAAADFKGAVADYQVALKMAPAEPALVADAASLFEKQGRIEDAIAGYEALYTANSKMQLFAANNLAMLLVTHKGDRASLDRALELTSPFSSSRNGNLLDTAGWVRFKRGEYQDALPLLARASSASPQSRVIRYHLAMDELQLGMRDRARSELESALAGDTGFTGMEEARAALAGLDAPHSG